MPTVDYDYVLEEELEDAHKIEVASYPPDEAASLDNFRYRQAHAPELFLGAYLKTDTGRTIVGYVCATLAETPSLSHDSMSVHVPGAPSVCIHSVCVAPAHRRQHIGLGLLQEYVARLQMASQIGGVYERILLITHEELRAFYERAGFEWVGPSAVVHGARPWFEMRKILKHMPHSTPHSTPHSHARSHAHTPPPGLWEALQKSSLAGRQRRARLLSSFSGGTDDLVDITGEDEDEVATNNCDLLCPREGCGSIIVKKGVARLVERESVELEPADHSRHGLAFIPPPPAVIHWWLVTPNAMAFENVGFSRPTPGVAAGDKKLKLLLCAECDLGPLGWSEEGGTEFYLACNRVGYDYVE